MSRIVVTGMGVISAIGNTAGENRQALVKGTCGITNLENFPSRFAGVMPFGEIKITTDTLKEQLHAYEHGVTRTMLLSLHAFNEAIADSNLPIAEISSLNTAFISGNTVGGMCLTDELYADTRSKDNGSEYLTSYDSASVAIYVQERYKMKGIINTFNTACSSSANAIMYGARLIQHGFAKRAIVGGADTLAKFTINGFNALRILSDETCRPFDKDRKGLNLGEGAAYLVLEKEGDAADKKIYATIAGYGNANDAFHPSSLSAEGDGPVAAMKQALKKANINAGEIGFINAHGTATENNDEVESVSMKKVFDQVPAFASTKGNTGHTLGAAGAIEAVYSILSLMHQEIYPALHFEHAIDATGLAPVAEYRKKSLEYVMSNSFGFGGNCTSLIFSKY
ncbi:beta-ketoacyl-[acyl-carrier-protein] synthase family protein [Panacibacter ginsenosidivorans]|uniref:Beta-ketoacyl-[acyl-carrier-protein] synthase family protein n=1 Tax=Panacibacter ginsenosidivorans TaxID=1813871 RepID=A0A5B8VDA1_9BACT|nr:beta-ketoacyl-[acyl-carrier-protein] synthase family protein [Panacibacter ginsenosidivorans]QEC69450.1 beta-ketoacyl-[acyl-carrier-protein] synthase family protein [Panacibacter ginsenosidivorans]